MYMYHDAYHQSIPPVHCIELVGDVSPVAFSWATFVASDIQVQISDIRSLCCLCVPAWLEAERPVRLLIDVPPTAKIHYDSIFHILR